jgi:hypothetical protein
VAELFTMIEMKKSWRMEDIEPPCCPFCRGPLV